jgi:hypothetical protein
MPKNVLFPAYHFGSLVQKRMTRDEDIIYTWELFLRVDNAQSMLSMSESKAADLFCYAHLYLHPNGKNKIIDFAIDYFGESKKTKTAV